MKNLRISFGRVTLLILSLCLTISLQAQEIKPVLQQYLEKDKSKWGLSSADIADWIITDQYTESESGITHIYLHQQYSGIRIFNAVSSAAIRNDKVRSFSNRFINNVTTRVNTDRAGISPQEAIIAAAGHLNLQLSETPALQNSINKQHQWTYSESGIAKKPIKVELVYQLVGNKLRLAYDVNLALKDSPDWWNIRIDAVTGEFLDKNNWTEKCNFQPSPGRGDGISKESIPISVSLPVFPSTPMPPPGSGFRVFPLPMEAPSFGPRQLLINPENITASPYGWLDTNGVAGAEFTITRGNNVFAYTDTLAIDSPQFSPDGGPGLNFDFPLNLTQIPSVNKAAIVTNLFYVNNRVHDILYLHGFNALSGNFQENNYGSGGLGQDYVLAEAQDGGGTNNANFSTPPDGQNGVMQMYLWTSTPGINFTVNSPTSIAGTYTGSGMSSFGPVVMVPITNDLVLVNDNTAPITDGCDPILNGAAINGKIALIDRGLCTFVSKVQAVEALGAIAVIVINNVAGAPFIMGGTGNVGIPSFMISQSDGNIIKNSINDGGTVNVTLPAMPPAISIDGSIDNGVVTHEYGHGVSNRLTGGPSNSNCLSNAENGSEGWSDWLALIMTIESGDTGTNFRPVGTYALAEPVTGDGIRNYPYCTSLAVNPQTYASLALSAEIHDIGEIWALVLWDMTWNLIDSEGFTSDWINGIGGNITSLNLVLEAMKLQACDPGFLDSRDAILMADSLIYNGLHTCLIWKAFAHRGMGANASQGDPNVVGDEVENFDLPTSCLIPTSAPLANFTVNATSNCTGTFSFTDHSDSIPQTWLWNFGDGSANSNIKNPSHTYTAPGTYLVTLIVGNTIGADTTSMTVTYAIVLTPLISGDTVVCSGQSTSLTSSVTGNNIIDWISGSTIIQTGISFITPPLYTTTTYTVLEHENFISGYVGPLNQSFSTGGYHNTTFEGKEKLVTYAPMRLISCLVDASGTANRTINLYDQSGTNLIQSVNVNIPNGQSTVTLNFEIPDPGTYWIGVSAFSNLYRNNNGANYPYTLSNLVSILTSNATGTPLDYYYYLYNWHVEQLHCESVPATVTINVVPALVPDYNYSSNLLSVNFIDLTIGNPQAWLWNFGDGTTSNLQNPIHIYAQSGTYTVQLIMTNEGCSDTITKILDVVSGVGELNNSSFVTLSPVPASNDVILSFGHPLDGKVNVDVLTIDGRKMRSYTFDNPSDHFSLQLFNLPDGIYFVRIVNQSSSAIKKMTIVH